MSDILEMTMLVCFGLSWPINVYKCFKARTAVGTSPLFIVLILVGYVSGITAKFMCQKINIVLIVYFLNLIIVLLNLAVYFRNRRLDKKALCMEHGRI